MLPEALDAEWREGELEGVGRGHPLDVRCRGQAAARARQPPGGGSRQGGAAARGRQPPGGGSRQGEAAARGSHQGAARGAAMKGLTL